MQKGVVRMYYAIICCLFGHIRGFRTRCYKNDPQSIFQDLPDTLMNASATVVRSNCSSPMVRERKSTPPKPKKSATAMRTSWTSTNQATRLALRVLMRFSELIVVVSPCSCSATMMSWTALPLHKQASKRIMQETHTQSHRHGRNL